MTKSVLHMNAHISEEILNGYHVNNVKLTMWTGQRQKTQILMCKKFPESGNFPECLQTFKSVHKLSEFLETFQSVQKLSRLYGNFAECPQTFQIVWKLSRESEKIPWCPDTFQRVWKLSRVTNKFSNV